jgi:hypothetical protein
MPVRYNDITPIDKGYKAKVRRKVIVQKVDRKVRVSNIERYNSK